MFGGKEVGWSRALVVDNFDVSNVVSHKKKRTAVVWIEVCGPLPFRSQRDLVNCEFRRFE